MTPPRPELEALLDNAAWARALARSLVRDPHHADDLVQRTFVAALEHPPRDSGSPRGWIASVLRNFVRQDARSGERREHHERAGARTEATDPDSVERTAGLQRELLDAVMTLSEPYRSTVWARYYDGLPPREIARRDAVSVKTVKARLARGLAELRNKLDKNRGGDRSAWMAALVPLAAGPHASAPFLGALMMDVKLKIAGAVVATAGLVVVLVRFVGQAPIQPDPLAQRPMPALELTAPHETSAPLAPVDVPATVRAPFVQRDSPAVLPVAPAQRTAKGRVLDLDLRPVRDLEVFARSSPRDDGQGKPALATSAEDGSFTAPVGAGHIELAARGREWVTVFAATNAWGDDDHYSIFVAPRCSLSGRVVDPAHKPIAGASVNFLVAASLRRDVGTQLDTTMPSDWLVQTDVEGRFAIENAPLVKGTVSAEAIGRKTAEVEAPSVPSWDLEIVLQSLEVKHLIVRGRVVDEHGQPIAGANVALGAESLLSNDDGRFAFDVDEMHDMGEAEQNADGVWVPRFRPDALFAVKAGKLPARVELPPLPELRSADQPGEFTLVLAGEPLEIRGRVLEADGKPVSNAMVRLGDETRFGMIHEKIGGEGIGVSTTAEKLLRGSAWSAEVRADRDGAFTLGGLLDREYHIIAFDPNTLRRATSEAIHAGSRSAEIRLPDRAGCVRVAGTVVGLDGTPIAGASVGLGAVIDDTRAPVYATHVETDEKGRFEFESVVSDGLMFSITHSSTFFRFGWRPDPKDALDKLEIKVARKAHVQVDLGTDVEKADQFSVVDAHGKPVDLMISRGKVMWMPEHGDIVQGKSEPVACAENGAMIVLYKAGKEIARQPVRLVPGEITVVRP
jgi:RNA polymerase sigma-70 factor (ECF subfamily)